MSVVIRKITVPLNINSDTTVCSKNINKQIVNIADENLTDYSFLSIGITILNQRII